MNDGKIVGLSVWIEYSIKYLCEGIGSSTPIRYSRLSFSGVSGNGLLQISHLLTSILISLSGGILVSGRRFLWLRVKVLIFYKYAHFGQVFISSLG